MAVALATEFILVFSLSHTFPPLSPIPPRRPRLTDVLIHTAAGMCGCVGDCGWMGRGGGRSSTLIFSSCCLFRFFIFTFFIYHFFCLCLAILFFSVCAGKRECRRFIIDVTLSISVYQRFVGVDSFLKDKTCVVWRVRGLLDIKDKWSFNYYKLYWETFDFRY